MKDKIHELLLVPDFDTIVQLAGQTSRVLSFLTALTYAHDPLVTWRAIEAIGLAAARIADDNPEVVRVHLRRMQWLLNDESGGIGWRLPEAMGEIIYNRPHTFAEFVPIIVSLFDMEVEDVVKFRAGILWALGRIAPVAPNLNQAEALPWIISCLDDPDPQTRGLSVWCLGQLRAIQILADHEALLADESPVEWYVGGRLTCQSVSDLTRAALGFQK